VVVTFMHWAAAATAPCTKPQKTQKTPPSKKMAVFDAAKQKMVSRLAFFKW